MIEHHHADLSAEERKRISDLFNRLDVNKDGKIDIKDLTEALQQLRVPTVPGQAQVRLPPLRLSSLASRVQLAMSRVVSPVVEEVTFSSNHRCSDSYHGVCRPSIL